MFQFTLKEKIMKRIFSKVSRKVLLASAVLATAVGMTAAVRAWWPERPTFTVAHPAPYVTFNSITDNPNYGDERTFYDVKDATNTSTGGFADKVQVKDGETLLLRTYVHNNAADNLNTVPDGKGGYVGVAKNTKVRIFLPTASATALRSNSYVSASNATPTEVADTVDFVGNSNFTLEYVPGSAVTYNNAHPTGVALNDSIVSTGANLGYETMNGTLPGCFQYTNIVTVKVKVKMPTPNYKVSKQVAVPGGQWSENVTAKPGDTVSYLIGFNNTGSTQLTDAAIRDKLPAHMQIVPNTTTITNTNHPSGVNAGTDAIVSSGIKIGTYNAGTNAYVSFKAKIDDQNNLPCGTTKLTNTAEAFVGNGPVVTDTADVVVTNPKDCTTPNQVADCQLLDVQKIGDRTVRATVTPFTANGAQLKLVTFDFGDNTKQVTDKTTFEHTYAQNGNYVVTATLTFMVNGQTVTRTSAACSKPINFVATPGQPTTLVDTGAGDVLGIFAAVTAAGALAYRFVLARRFNV
jgi:uncharacterized repeat protein (TIGR01451 family)